MSDSAYLVGALLLRKRTASGGAALVEVEVVSRFLETNKYFGMNPVAEMRPERRVTSCHKTRKHDINIYLQLHRKRLDVCT